MCKICIISYNMTLFCWFIFAESEGIQHVLQEIVNTTQLLTEQARLLQQALDMESGALKYTLDTRQCQSLSNAACTSLRATTNTSLLKLTADYNIVSL